jgi:hypothetical protein
MFDRTQTLAQSDPDLWAAIVAENRRQESHIELIASENYASPAVLAAQGSQLTNKYAEGYPGKRYYGGCEYVDIAEQLAIDRAKELFGSGHGECPAAFGGPGEPDGLLRGAQAGRHGARHEPAPRRPPDARLAGQPVGQVVPRRRLRLDPESELIDYDARRGSRTSTSPS